MQTLLCRAWRLAIACVVACVLSACARTVIPEFTDASEIPDAEEDVPLVSNIVQLAARTWHSCARRSTGSVVCWGSNRDAVLGDGTTNDSFSPVTVAGLDDAIDIAAAEPFTCATHSDHTVGCWGHGFGNTIAPVEGAVDAVELCAGEQFACARQASGHVICWIQTAAIVPGIDDAVGIGCGFMHACAIRRDHTAICWGWNLGGQLGNGLSRDSTEMAPVVGLTDVVDITGTYSSSCAVRGSGDVVCWGTGYLGDGPESYRLVPGAPVPGVNDAVQVAMAWSSCVRQRDGTVACWGSDLDDALGGDADGPVPRETVEPIAGLTEVVELAAGQGHFCARRRNGEVLCWGRNDQGQLGDGTTDRHSTPVRVVGL